MSVSARLRRWYWQRIRRYDAEICQRCGRPVSRRLGQSTYWYAPNALWNRLQPSEVGVYCPACFTDDARSKGVWIGWVAVETVASGYGDSLSDALELAHAEHVIAAVQWEWYTPPADELGKLAPDAAAHVRNGGLLLRPLTDAGRAALRNGTAAS